VTYNNFWSQLFIETKKHLN